jgi:small subunit ribosomal protein SAe
MIHNAKCNPVVLLLDRNVSWVYGNFRCRMLLSLVVFFREFRCIFFAFLQPIKEAALGNIPIIAFCDTDSPMRHVDIAIPANNKGKHSIGSLFWLLGRMVLQMRGTVTPTRPWEVMVDLFFYREPDESKDRDEEEAGAPEFTPGADYVAPPALAGTGGEEWDQTAAEWTPAEGSTVPPTVIPPSVAPAEWVSGPAPTPAGWDPAPLNPGAYVGAPPAAPAGWDPVQPAPSGWDPAQ